jgi:hypothetical protein
MRERASTPRKSRVPYGSAGAKGQPAAGWKTWLVRALWVLVALQILFVARYAVLFGLISLTGDEDPTSVIQLGRPSLMTLVLPLAMLTQQGADLAVLALLTTLLVLSYRWRRLSRRGALTPHPS